MQRSLCFFLFQESLRESQEKTLQEREQARDEEREREREREREQDRSHSSRALKELETKVQVLEQLESQVQVLVERGLVRLERTPSGQAELQVVPADPLVSPTGQTKSPGFL